jgi:hypothetical protein
MFGVLVDGEVVYASSSLSRADTVAKMCEGAVVPVGRVLSKERCRVISRGRIFTPRQAAEMFARKEKHGK